MGHPTRLAILRGLLQMGGPKCEEGVTPGPPDRGPRSWLLPGTGCRGHFVGGGPTPPDAHR